MENLPDLNFQFIESLTELASVSGVTVKNYFSCVNDVLTTDNFIETRAYGAIAPESLGCASHSYY